MSNVLPPHRQGRFLVYAITAAIMIVGPMNFLLFRILYDSFGSEYAFFVSQGVNAFYVVVGGFVLYPRMWKLKLRPWSNSNGWNEWFICIEPNYDEITKDMRMLPQRRFMQMAVLDCAGTFLAAMGAVATPGQIQTLLNQALIPFTMSASALFLFSKYTPSQYGGAATILFGALVAIAPSFGVSPSSGGDARSSSGSSVGAILLYLSSNLPMALSAVYKEYRFASDDISPLYLTQWVSIYQFLFGFVLMPLQLVPGISSPHGMSVSEMGSAFTGGWQCYLERPGACPPSSFGTFWLLPAYVSVNYLFNTLGLFLTKHGGANLNSISYSMLLPLTTLSNALPWLGPFREQLQVPTVVGLVVVLAGFALYEDLCAPAAAAAAAAADSSSDLAPSAQAAPARSTSSSNSTSGGGYALVGVGCAAEERAGAGGEAGATATKQVVTEKSTLLAGQQETAAAVAAAAAASASRERGGGGRERDEEEASPRFSSSDEGESPLSSPRRPAGTALPSVRQQRTSSFQERLVLVALPILGTSSSSSSFERRSRLSSSSSSSSSSSTSFPPSKSPSNSFFDDGGTSHHRSPSSCLGGAGGGVELSRRGDHHGGGEP